MPEYVPARARKLRYRQFAAKYIKNGYNGLQTVLDCGFTDNPDSAKVIASRLLTYVYVDNEITKLQAKAKMDADEVLERLTEVARSKVEFKGSDVVKAAELLGKGHKLFVDKVETTDTSVSDGVAQGLMRSIESAASRDNLPLSDAAIGLYDALPEHADISLWPAEFQGILKAHIAAQVQPTQPVTEVSGEQ